MLAVAWVICLSAMIAGVWLSFRLDSAPAPTIVLILTAMFAVALVRRQVLTRRAGQPANASSGRSFSTASARNSAIVSPAMNPATLPPVTSVSRAEK